MALPAWRPSAPRWTSPATRPATRIDVRRAGRAVRLRVEGSGRRHDRGREPAADACWWSTTTRSSRQGLVSLLDRRPEFQVVAEAGTVAEVAGGRRGATSRISCVMDVRLPDGSGVEACRGHPRRAPGDPGRHARRATRTRKPVLVGDRRRRQRVPAEAGPGARSGRRRSRRSAAASRCSTRAVTGRGRSQRMRRIAHGGRATTSSVSADPTGTEDPRPGRRGQDEQGDRGRGLPVGQDREELRQLDPGEAQPRAAGTGGCLRRPSLKTHSPD